MAEKSEPEKLPPASTRAAFGIYIDSSALAKLYVPEPKSEVLDRFLAAGVTPSSQTFRLPKLFRLSLDVDVTNLLLSTDAVPLRTLDALHVSLV